MSTHDSLAVRLTLLRSEIDHALLAMRVSRSTAMPRLKRLDAMMVDCMELLEWWYTDEAAPDAAPPPEDVREAILEIYVRSEPMPPPPQAFPLLVPELRRPASKRAKARKAKSGR